MGVTRGLTSSELLTILRTLAGQRIACCHVVGAAPADDHAEITTIAAAYMVYDLITLMAGRVSAS